MDVAGQVNAARKAAGLTDRSSRGKLLVRGNDRLAFLHNMLSNSITTLTPGKGCRAEMLDERGHVVADLRVFVDADHVLIDTEPGRSEQVRAALDKYVIMDDVQIEDASASFSLFTLSGPRAEEIAKQRFTLAPPGLYDHAAADGVRVARSRWTGAADLDAWVPVAQAATIRADLEKAVTAIGGVVLTAEAFEVMRIEAGVARQGSDLEDVVALEARLEKDGAVSFTKGCYLGQEVMARIDSRGHVNRLLVGIALDGAAVPAAGTAIRAGGKDVGKVTSSALSPTLGKVVALAYVRREHSEPGSVVEIAGAQATVAALPFVS